MQKILFVCISAQEGDPDAEFQPRLQLPQTFTETRICTELQLKFCSTLQPLKWQKLKPQTKKSLNFGEHRNESRRHQQTLIHVLHSLFSLVILKQWIIYSKSLTSIENLKLRLQYL